MTSLKLEECNRSLPASRQLKRQDIRAAPAAFICPITLEVMQDPVVVNDGHTCTFHGTNLPLSVAYYSHVHCITTWTRYNAYDTSHRCDRIRSDLI